MKNNSIYNRITTLGDSLVLQSPSNIIINSLIVSIDSVTQNWDTTATLIAGNSGQADFVVDSIKVNPYGLPLDITPALLDTINGDSSQSYVLNINIPSSATTGLQTLRPYIYGRDINSNTASIDSSTTAQWQVLSSPVVTLDTIYSDSIVVAGEGNIPVTLVINNAGTTPVLITDLALNAFNGTYLHQPAGLPVLLPGNTDTTLVCTTAVFSSSYTGPDSLSLNITYKNSISLLDSTFTGTPLLTWEVQSASDIDILSVQTEPQFLSQGQDSVSVSVRIRN